MARPLRIQFQGAFYHVTSRGNERKGIFKSAADRNTFLSYLKSAVERHQARIHVYCLMSNHYHLLLETPAGNLSRIMHHINGAYTTYYNIKRSRAGHLLQSRYKAILVEADAYAVELSRYIHLNPVRAGIVKAPEDHPWSSYRVYAGKTTSPEWLYTDFILGYFDQATSEFHAGYRRFVIDAMDRSPDNPFDHVIASTFLAGADFIEKIKTNLLKGKKKDRNLPSLRAMAAKPDIETIIAAVGPLFGDNTALSKQAALYICHRYSGLKLAEIGRSFGIGESGVTQASRRFSARLDGNAKLRTEINTLVGQWQVSKV